MLNLRHIATGVAVVAVAGVIWYARSKDTRSKRGEWLRTIKFNGKWEKMAAIEPSQVIPWPVSAHMHTVVLPP